MQNKFCCIYPPAPFRPNLYDVFTFGVQGGGRNLDTGPIRSAIDACHQAGGGGIPCGSVEIVYFCDKAEYQWFFNDEPIEGATESRLEINEVSGAVELVKK